MRLRYAAAALVAVLAAPAAAAPGTLTLPAPAGTIPVVVYPGIPRERLLQTFVPGPVTDDERIEVLVGPTGEPASVTVTQRLVLTGTGDYSIRERGPAKRVTALDGTVEPVIQRGAVVWQGFSPGRRELAARIELDPAREALLLPLRVELDRSPGRLVVRLVNQTRQPRRVPAGDVPAAAVAGPLDRLRAYAEAHGLRQPPAAGRGLPTTLAATDLTACDVVSAAPLRVEGTVRFPGATGVAVSGPGAAATGDGATLKGVLSDTAEITFASDADFTLDLSVVPTLDPRPLRPPRGLPSWAAWAAGRPPEAERRAAVDVLVDAALSAARADEVAPYLGHPGPGTVTTAFRYALAPPPPVVVADEPLRPRPVPIALTGLAVLALAGSGVLVWRRL